MEVNPTRFAEERLNKLFEGAVRATGVKGDIAEFGTLPDNAISVQALTLAINAVDKSGLAMLPGAPPKRLHVFSSFAGHPPLSEEADRTAPMARCGAWGPKPYAGITPDRLAAGLLRFLPSERIALVPGAFTDTVDRIDPATRFAMVHMDCDLYASTALILNALFGRGLVSEGAMIFFDDWNRNRASNLFGERRAWAECVERFHIEWSDGGAYGLTSNMMLVHGYDGMPGGAAP